MPYTMLKILTLGDSYTIGESLPPSQSWPRQLTRALRAAGLNIVDTSIIAQTGWTTRDLLTALETMPPEGRYDWVGLSIGVNNQYQGRALATYREEFGDLLKVAIHFTGGSPAKVLVLSIPDWGVTPFAAGRDRAQIRAEIAQFNQINQRETLKAGAHYLDITPLSRAVRESPGLLAADELHFSAQMYAAWVKLMYPMVYASLQTRGSNDQVRRTSQNRG